MTYAKNSTITAIHRPITNGMYNDTYTVIYSNGIRRNYTIKGAMNKKHFEFIQSATVESRYSKHTGKHTSDVFTAPVEPQEEPTTEEPTTEEPTTEEATQEGQTMRASREFFALEEKTRKADNHYNIVADSDTEYTVKNAPTTEAAVKLAMIKYATKLESVGTPAAALLASAIRDAIKYEYFSAANGYNYSGNGGGALEICTDYIDEKTTLVYLRVAEILEEGEEPEEEKPTENKTDSAFIAEMFAALDYFKRVLWSYTEAECCTRSERDISGDFWGAHECSVILSFVNALLKAQGAEPHYKLKNDFDDLSECFEEIKQKFEYGDERTIEEIIAEYNFS